MSNSNYSDLVQAQIYFVQDVAKLIEHANDLGISLTFGEAYRTKLQQADYVRRGLSKITTSNHQRRLAIDFNFFINGNLVYEHHLLNMLGRYWECLRAGNRWGGNYKSFKDTPHFERVL